MNKEDRKAWVRKYIQRPDVKLKRQENQKRWRESNRDKYNTYSREYRQRIRKEVLDLLGNKCSNPNCLVPGGCMDERCLQIDHIRGNGKQERMELGGDCISVYRRVLEHPEDYQLLCANCNWIKKYDCEENLGVRVYFTV